MIGDLSKDSMTEEADQLRRSIKKYKRNDEDDDSDRRLTEDMDMGQQSTSPWRNGTCATVLQ